MKKLEIHSRSFLYVEESFRRWLDILGFAPSTVYQLPNYIREFFFYLEGIGVYEINSITAKLIREYYMSIKHRSNQRRGGALSNNYLNKHLQALYKFALYLRQSGKLELPPLEIEREEETGKDINVLTIEEVKQLYKASYIEEGIFKPEAIAARDRAMLSIFYGCGLRRNEGYNLDLSDINFDRQIIHVRMGKNYKERFVPFNKTNLKYLQEYAYDYRQMFVGSKDNEAFFLSLKGNRMNTQGMVIRLHKLQQLTGDIEFSQKEIALHTLRHSIATHLLHAGMELEKISRFLGHSSLESTQIYTHLTGQI
jgi:integrase/recombinase XerD